MIKKRVMILAVVALLVLSTNAYALKGTSDFGIGAQMTSINFGGVGGMLTLHAPGVPLYFAVGGDFGNEMAIAGTIDYWFLNQTLAGATSWYVGVGGFVGVTTARDGSFVAGPRLPIGLQLWLLDRDALELFLEVAPAWGPFRSSEFNRGGVHAQVALGFRIWP